MVCQDMGLSVCSFKEIRKINNASITWYETCYKYEVDCLIYTTAFANTAYKRIKVAVSWCKYRIFKQETAHGEYRL